MKIKRRSEIVIELDANEADDFRSFLYRASTDPEFYYYEQILSDMYEKLGAV